MVLRRRSDCCRYLRRCGLSESTDQLPTLVRVRRCAVDVPLATLTSLRTRLLRGCLLRGCLLRRRLCFLTRASLRSWPGRASLLSRLLQLVLVVLTRLPVLLGALLITVLAVGVRGG